MTTRSKLGLIPIGLYVMLMPFYLAPPSMPQAADFLMLFMGIWMFMTHPFDATARVKKIVILLAAFFIYSVLVNGYFSLALNDISILRSSVFYIFNLLAFATIYMHYRLYGSDFLKFVATMVAISICFQGFVAFSGLHFGSHATRATIFFNNPNQLGFWSLLSMSILALAATKIKLPLWLMLPAFICGTLITALSLSKAAMVGIAVVFLLMGLRRPALVVSALVIGLIFVSTPTGQDYVDRVSHRFATLGQQDDDSLDGRFYDRIFDNPQYWVFGSGEGGFDRYTAVEDKLKEIHSSFGTMFFSYGFIGSFLFFGAVGLMFGKKLTAWLYAVPLMLYSVTHDGLRFTSFWLFLAFTVCFFEWLRTQQEESPPEFYREPLAELAYKN